MENKGTEKGGTEMATDTWESAEGHELVSAMADTLMGFVGYCEDTGLDINDPVLQGLMVEARRTVDAAWGIGI